MARRKGEPLTTHQLCRLATCSRCQEVLGRAVSVGDLLAELDAEPALVGRFLRDMVARRYMRRAKAPMAGRRCSFYVVTARWYILADDLRAIGRLPGVCCVCGTLEAVSFPFMRRFFCRDCLMEAHRDDFPAEETSCAVAPGRRAPERLGRRPVRRSRPMVRDSRPVPNQDQGAPEGGSDPAWIWWRRENVLLFPVEIDRRVLVEEERTNELRSTNGC